MEQLLDYNLPAKAQIFVNVILLWIGFAMVVGFVARIIVPGKIARSPYIIFLIGLTGGCLGPLIVSHYFELKTFNPIGPVGFISAILASVCCLIVFYILFFFFKNAPIKKTEDDDFDLKDE